LFDPPSDPEPIYKKQDALEKTRKNEPDDEPLEVSEFAYEKDLQNFLSKNLYQVEPGLKLYEEEDITGIEFPVGNRYIDILALDNDNNYVVVELKVSRGYDRVVGQLLRYMAWIRKNQADNGQVVRGIIIAREISEDLLLACSEIPNIDLYEYQLSVSLRKINSK
jgi:RecB family endonuclease NucS